MNSSFGVGVAAQARRLVACTVIIAIANATYAQNVSFGLSERGSSSNPTIQLQLPISTSSFPGGGVRSLTSPSGEIFDAQNPAALTKTFTTLDQAFNFLAGGWHGTFTPIFPFNSPPLPFDFQVSLISTSDVYRGLPQNVTLSEGLLIPNGKTFLMTWDFESDEPRHSTSLQVLAKINSFAFSSLSSFGKPTGGTFSVGGTSSSGNSSGSASFMRRYEPEPGATEYRILTTYKASGSQTPTPAFVDVTMGSVTDLSSAFTNHGDGDANSLNNPPVMGMRYTRTGDAINLTLVPEPATWALAMSVAVMALRPVRQLKRE